MNYKILFTLLVSLFCLSQSGNIIRFCDTNALSIAFYRLFLAFFIMLPFAWKNLLSSIKSMEKKNAWRIFFMGFIFAFHLIFWIKGVQQTKVANAAICFCINPIFISIGAFFFFREKIHKNFIIALFWGMMGILCIAYDDFSLSMEFLWGDILALLSGLLFAFYFLLGKKLRQTTDSLTMMNMVYFVSAMTCLCFCVSQDAPLVSFSIKTWIALLGMAVVPTILGHFLFMYVTKFFKAGATSASTLLEPVFAGIVAYLAFHEKISSLGMIGYFFIFLCMIFLFLSQPQDK